MSDLSVARESSAKKIRRRPRAGTNLLVLGIAAFVAIAVAAFWAGTIIHGEAASIPQHIQEPRPTATVGYGILTDRLTVQGSIQPHAGVAIKSLTPQIEAGAVPLVTAVPIHPGSAIVNGSVLAAVAGQPIIAVEGSVPMYRPFRLGRRGEDVAQFQQALAALGYSIGDRLGEYGLSTASDAEAMFQAQGYNLPRENILAPQGRASDTRGGADAKSAHATQAVPIVPAAALIFVKHLPARVVKVNVQVGQQVGSALATLSWGMPDVTASLEASQLQTLHVGMHVSWAGHPNAVGIITSISHGRSEEPSGGGEGTSSSSSGTVTVQFDSHAHLPPIGEQIEISVMRHSSGTAVLSVPFSAIKSGAGGESYVEVRHRSRFVKLAVDLGFSTGGYVAVKPIRGVLPPDAAVAIGE